MGGKWDWRRRGLGEGDELGRGWVVKGKMMNRRWEWKGRGWEGDGSEKGGEGKGVDEKGKKKGR